jgi:hypothetical protein
MNTKRLGTIFIILGFLSILFASFGTILHFIPKNLDFIYLTSTGVVFIASGTILSKKKPL